ncbi:putative pentatricopeptide [Rosa chinensis]|uniref:Putative pentatricopeptide n=1 Tax=Rosa chinensis TaxID=74649 RepID=A0A2P6SHS3_ROSCH|nr:putative pentatricopeptide [Rosa chinensis]
MPVRNVAAWNALITGFVDCSRECCWKTAGPDDITVNGLLRGCIELKDVEIDRQLHCFAVKLGFDLSCFVGSALVACLGASSTWGSCEPGKHHHGTVTRQSFNNIGNARKAFDAMSIKNVVSWNTIIVGYGQHGKGIQAVKLLWEMFREHFYPDEFILASIVRTCGNVPSANELMEVHAYIQGRSQDRKEGWANFSLTNILRRTLFLF